MLPIFKVTSHVSSIKSILDFYLHHEDMSPEYKNKALSPEYNNKAMSPENNNKALSPEYIYNNNKAMSPEYNYKAMYTHLLSFTRVYM